MDCATGESFPLARTREMAEGGDWEEFSGLGYLFSPAGLDRANGLLRDAAKTDSYILMVDEIGRLEMRGGGLRPGLEAVLASTRTGRGWLLVSCRLQSLSMVKRMAEDLGLGVRAWTPDEGGDLVRILSD
jgi:hypothetical protein